jgi:hypothetical protein
VRVEDAGEYVCEAENILGKDTVRGRLHVNSGRCPSRKRRVLGDLAEQISCPSAQHMIYPALTPPLSCCCISNPRSQLNQRNAVKA